MRRLVWVEAFALLACVAAGMAACKAVPEDPVSRGVAALGGADTLAAARTFLVKGTVKQWEPEQSLVAGGEPRFANESTFTLLTDLAAGTSRTDWERKYLYPLPRNYTFSEIVTPTAGYVAGIDSSGRTKQSLDSNPPAHTMSGLRLAASQREALRTSPVLLFSMSKARERVSPVADVTVDGTAYPAVEYKVGE